MGRAYVAWYYQGILDEIKNVKLMDSRDNIIKQYIFMYPDIEIPKF